MAALIQELHDTICWKYGPDSLQASEARMILSNLDVFVGEEAVSLLSAILREETLFAASGAA